MSLECPVDGCYDRFETPGMLSFHVRKKHGLSIEFIRRKELAYAMSEEEVKEEEAVEEAEGEGEKVVYKTCPECGQKFETLPDLTRHRAKEHPDVFREQIRQAALKRERLKKEVKEAPEEKPEEDELELVMKKGREGLNEIKGRRLEQILSEFGSEIKNWQRNTILSEWRMNPNIRDQPQWFYLFLVNDIALRENVALAVTRRVFAVEQEYAHVLQRKGLPVVTWQGVQQQTYQPVFHQPFLQQPQYYPVSFQQAQQSQPPYLPPPPATSQPQYPQPAYRYEEYARYPETVTKSDVESIAAKTTEEVVRKLLAEKEEKNELRQLRSDIDLIGSNQAKIQEQIQSLQGLVRDVIEGKVRPATAQDVMSEKVNVLTDLIKDLDRKVESVRADFEKKLTEKEKEELKEKLEKVVAAHSQVRKELENLRLRTQIGGSQGYQSDQYRLVADAMNHLTTVISQKEPIKNLAVMLGSKPPVKEATPQVPSEVMAELEREGYVE